MLAASQGLVSIVTVLVEAGVNVNARGKVSQAQSVCTGRCLPVCVFVGHQDGETALIRAAERGRTRTIDVLASTPGCDMELRMHDVCY